jgi:hypothetical protein
MNGDEFEGKAAGSLKNETLLPAIVALVADIRQMSTQKRAEQFPVVGDLQMKQFVDNGLGAKVGGLAEQIGIESEAPLR